MEILSTQTTVLLGLVNQLEGNIISSLPIEWQHAYSNLHKYQHPQSRHFPLMNPFHVVLIILGYLLVVFVGKAIMNNRQKMELKLFSMLHNAFLICLSSYMCFECINQAVTNKFTLWGNGIDSSEKGIPLARVLWLFYASKVVEFIDTFIMVLKKNDRQISFLHVYHHVSIFSIWWVVIFYGPGGDGYFTAALNSFIHIVMYSYYLLASLGIRVPWKSLITMGQMTQFVLMLCQATYTILFPSKYPLFLGQILFVYMLTLLVLFANFFIQDSKRAKAERAKQKKKE